CSTSTMKQRELYVALSSHLMQRAMGFENLPSAREHPAVFVRIGVAKHDLLPSLPRLEQTCVVGAGPQISADDRTVAQILNRFKERHRHHTRIGSICRRDLNAA